MPRGRVEDPAWRLKCPKCKHLGMCHEQLNNRWCSAGVLVRDGGGNERESKCGCTMTLEDIRFQYRFMG